MSYTATLQQPLMGPPVRFGSIYHLVPEEASSFEQGTLRLHANGIQIQRGKGTPFDIAWSPFSLVQACRLHTVQADTALPWMRLFKVSVFQHGATHFFATYGDNADSERARWVADISRAIRVLTQSLFPEFNIRSDPVPGIRWTATRLLAGYLLLLDDQGVSVVYCELHVHMDGAANFAAYEDESCAHRVMHLGIDQQTCVSERVGVDCSCFSFDGYHFTTRTSSEKMLWLRCISNLKVKMRHHAPNPTPEELDDYRASVSEYAEKVHLPDYTYAKVALLPRRLIRGGAPNDSSPRGNGHPGNGADAAGSGNSNPSCTNGATSTTAAGSSAPSGIADNGSQPTTEGLASEGTNLMIGPTGPLTRGSPLQLLTSPHKMPVLPEPHQDAFDMPAPLPPEVPAAVLGSDRLRQKMSRESSGGPGPGQGLMMMGPGLALPRPPSAIDTEDGTPPSAPSPRSTGFHQIDFGGNSRPPSPAWSGLSPPPISAETVGPAAGAAARKGQDFLSAATAGVTAAKVPTA